MKLALKILAALVGVIVLIILALLIVLDANMFKPRLEALAREQGIALAIGGDMDWQLWPALGIEVRDISLADLESPETPIAQLGRASLRLAIRPLFAGELAVHHLVVENAVLDLIVDEQGQGNWQALFDQASPSTPSSSTPAAEPTPKTPAASDGEADSAQAPETSAEGAQLHLAVEQISVGDSTFNFTDFSSGAEAADAAKAEPLRLSLQDVDLNVEGFNLQGAAFPLDLQWQMELRQAENDSLRARGQLHNTLQLAADFSQLEAEDGQLILVIEGEEPARIQLDYSISLHDLQEDFRYLGAFTLASTDLKDLLQSFRPSGGPLTRADYALTNLQLSGNVTGDAASFTLDPFALQLDKTKVQGSLAITDFAKPALRLSLQGDRLNVDDYMPPAAPAEPEATTSGDEELTPLQAIGDLTAEAKVAFGELTLADIVLQNLDVVVSADDGLVTLSQANTQTLGGIISATGSLDARGETAVIEAATEVESLQLAALMDLFAAEAEGEGEKRDDQTRLDVSGGINATASLTTRGTTRNQLLQEAAGDLAFVGDQVRIAPLNVEEKFCEIVQAVTDAPESQAPWPQATQLQQVKGQAHLADQVITVSDMSAGVERLLVGAEGTIDIAGGTYDLRLPLTLTAPQSSQNGCSVQSEFWLNRTLSLLRCRGGLEGLDPVSDCRPDAEGLASLVRDFAEYKLKKKHGAKIDAAKQEAEQKLDEEKEELRRKAEEELGGEGAKELEKRLEQLFD